MGLRKAVGEGVEAREVEDEGGGGEGGRGRRHNACLIELCAWMSQASGRGHITFLAASKEGGIEASLVHK